MRKLIRMAALLCAFSLAGTITSVPLEVRAQAAQGNGTISGVIVDAAGGVSIANAHVILYQGTKQIATSTSDANGAFAFPNLPNGIYSVEIRAEGYGGARSSDLVSTTGSTTQFRAVLQRATTESTGLQEIGRVSASGGRNQLSTSTTISNTLSTDFVQKQGFNRIGDALGTLPGVNLSGLSSSIGDDLGINIRGFGTSETQTLIDGHPIGPFGPGSGGFSFQDSPYFAFGRTVVTVGSGALGLYGTDSIGGTIDMQTLEPTNARHFSITEGAGNFGTSLTNITATGMIGNKLGYALDHGVIGTYGPYKPAQRVQAGALSSGPVGPDFSDANVAANTYATSGNYLLRSDLLKLRYAFDDKTQLTATYLDANSWDDKSGNGDNCFNTVGYQVYQGNGIIAGGANTYPNTAKPGDPGSITCTGSIAVKLNSGPACVDANTYGSLSAGLVPGGPGPWQAHRLHDYHARLTHLFGNNFVTVDDFQDRFSTDYNRNTSSTATDANGNFLFFNGGFNSDFYDTTGFLVSDDIQTQSNDLGFGFYVQHQRIYGDTYNYDPVTAPNGQIVPKQEFASGQSNFFLRDVLNGDKKVSYYLNAWLKRSTVTQKTTFDPRLSAVIKLTSSDVLRLTGGRSDGEPSPQLLYGPTNYNTTPTNLSHLGTPPYLLSVGQASNPTLLPETSTDFEVAYGHRFKADSIIQIDVYSSFEKNRIFSGPVALTSVGSNQPSAFLLNAYLQQLQLLTGKPASTFSAADLGVTTNSNAASARFQGVEITGRARFNPRLYLDYSYDLQSASYLGVTDALLQKNATVLNNAQINGLPLRKYSFGLDFANLHGFEVRLDNYYTGENNPYQRNPFFYSNANITQELGPHAALNIGVQNVFNNAYSNVSAVGNAPYIPTNQFNPYTDGRQQNFAVTGLLPTQITGSVTFKL